MNTFYLYLAFPQYNLVALISVQNKLYSNKSKIQVFEIISLEHWKLLIVDTESAISVKNNYYSYINFIIWFSGLKRHTIFSGLFYQSWIR